MNPRIRCALLIFLLLLVFLYAGTIEGSGIVKNPVRDLYKGVGVFAKSRKLLELEAVIDYEYAGPNPKHDPKAKRGGGGSKNP